MGDMAEPLFLGMFIIACKKTSNQPSFSYTLKEYDIITPGDNIVEQSRIDPAPVAH
jgi:hypothetical protein